jgi:hypothetical protein
MGTRSATHAISYRRGVHLVRELTMVLALAALSCAPRKSALIQVLFVCFLGLDLLLLLRDGLARCASVD